MNEIEDLEFPVGVDKVDCYVNNIHNKVDTTPISFRCITKSAVLERK